MNILINMLYNPNIHCNSILIFQYVIYCLYSIYTILINSHTKCIAIYLYYIIYNTMKLLHRYSQIFYNIPLRFI